MKKIHFLGGLAALALIISAFSFIQNPQGPKHPKVTTGHIPIFAAFGTDSFYCDPAEAKHLGKVNHRFNTLHMKEKGEDNIIVHFKSKKYPGKEGKMENDYVHFDVLYAGGTAGPRFDTHITLTWKGKKYHVKGNMANFNVTSLTWKEDKQHFSFSADFSARMITGGVDTTSFVFKGKIVEEMVKVKASAAK